METFGVLRGGGKEPRYLQGYPKETSGLPVKKILRFASSKEINQVNIAYSGAYYERRDDGWYETSDTEICDKERGLPADGRFICE
jgi:hypothetical protein